MSLPQGGRGHPPSWEAFLQALEPRTIDIEIMPVRFVEQILYEKDFVIPMRKGHPFADDPTLDRYCAMPHLLVSSTVDPQAQVDDALMQQGRSRRVALTVPSFMQALVLLGQTDLVAALPREIVAANAARFGLRSTEVPLPLRRYRVCAVATKASMMDAGVAWLFGLLLWIQ